MLSTLPSDTVDAHQSSTVQPKQINSSQTDTSSHTNTKSFKHNYSLNHDERLSADELSSFGVVGADPFGLTQHPILALLLIFLAGLGLAFTPCILPMLPIVANIVAEQENPSAKKSFMLSASYGIGVATAYGLLGALIAYLGGSFGILGLLQNPVILLGFAVIFVLLGLYMLEVVKIQLPQAISQPLHKISQAGNHKLGSVSGSYLVGLLSALVVSPCVSAPLSGVLVAVASIGNIALGFVALFSLGLGLSLPLVLFATTEGKLLPNAGEWMNRVKHAFAYLMFAVALIMVERVFQHPIILMVWAVWFVALAWLAWGLASKLKHKALPYYVINLVAVLSVIWAGCLSYGAIVNKATDSLQPLVTKTSINQGTVNHQGSAYDESDNKSANKLAHSHIHKQPIHITTLAELDTILAKETKVLVDLEADWCIECRIMEKDLFVSPPEQIKGWQIVKVDLTETDQHSKAVLERYNLVGPPTLLYYSQGQLLTKQVGQVKRNDFEQLLDALNQQLQ